MEYSRDTFYRVKEAYETGGVEALRDESERKPNRKNRVSEGTESAVAQMAFDEPAWGQVRISNELRKAGIFVSGCRVRGVWHRHGLETAHPGYRGSQDTYYVGFIKGVGKIYQQTFVDTYFQVVCAKVDMQKVPTLQLTSLMTECYRSLRSMTCHNFVCSLTVALSIAGERIRTTISCS